MSARENSAFLSRLQSLRHDEQSQLRRLVAPVAQRRAYAAFLFDLAGENKLLGVPELGTPAPGIQANSVAVLDRRLATRIAGEARALRLPE